MSTVRTISTAELEQRFLEGWSGEIWNVLTDDYFSGEMIPGSRRVPLDRIGSDVAASHLPKDVEIVVYCAGPHCPQSGFAAEKLATLGYTRVLAYEGGLEAWEAAGNTVVTLGAVGVN